MHIVTNYQNDTDKRTFKSNRRNIRCSVRRDRKPIVNGKGKGDPQEHPVPR